MNGELTAAEALGILAYGNPKAFDEPTEIQARLARWGCFRISNVEFRRLYPLRELRWVIARVRWQKHHARRFNKWRPCPLPPLIHGHRAQLRRMMRQYLHPSHKLLQEVTIDLKAAKLAQRKKDEANSALCSAAYEGKLTITGRKGRFAAHELIALQHEVIPRIYFKQRGLRITRNGWITMDDRVPFDNWSLWRRAEAPDYCELSFNAGEIQALRKAMSPDQAQIDAWMLKAAEDYYNLSKKKPKASQLITDCIVEFGCRNDDAELAQKRLPPHLRRTQGEVVDRHKKQIRQRSI